MEENTERLTIRRAQTGDENQLAAVHVKAWQETYKGIIEQSYLDNLNEEIPQRIENWVKTLQNQKRWVWVAEEVNNSFDTKENQIIGFVVLGPPRDPNRDNYIELGAIYLLASHKNKGIGKALLQTAFDFAKTTLNLNRAYCWVLAENPTVGFYKNSGAHFSGITKQDNIGDHSYTEHAYEWERI